MAVAGAATLMTTLLAPAAWFVAAIEGLLAVGVIFAAYGWGAWPAVWLRATGAGRLKRAALAVALGVGLLGFLTLALGTAGALGRVTAWSLVAGGWLLAVAAIGREAQDRRLARTSDPQEAGRAGPGSLGLRRVGWGGAAVGGTALGVVIGVALCGASLPPGILWDDEGKGYDALIYHLQAPREYYDAGRIQFLAHNVYASFPQQVEILYLLAMHLAGGPLAGAIPAQWLHLLLGAGAVLALAAWAPRGAARWIVAGLAGSVPWLAYVGCLAYVELGTLLFAVVAGGLLIDALEHDRDAARSPELRHDRADPTGGTTLARLLWTAGLCAGLAGGTKYTALALVVAALGLAWLVAARGPVTARLRRGAIYAIGAAIAFSPWLIRNELLAGNPVYPFAYRWFGGAAWSDEQDAQWARGHRVPEAMQGAAGRTRMLWNELLAAPMFAPTLTWDGLRMGLLPVLAIVVVGLAFRSRAGVLLCIWLGLIVLIWAGATHMPGRFVVIGVAPFGLLIGVVLRGRSARWIAAAAVAAGLVASLNAWTLVRTWQAHDRAWKARGVALAGLPGRVELVCEAQPINEGVPPDGYVWLVGDARAFYLRPRAHYTVVFNRDSWLAYAERATPDEAVAWLRTQGVTHVVFSWLEIERLRGTYGFPEWVSREWVARLCSAGLRRVAGSDDAVELFEVPRALR